MKFFSVIEQTSKEAIEVFSKKRGLSNFVDSGLYSHPQEDYLLCSENPPVFVVADGVTLGYMKFYNANIKYPNPSPAGDVSRIFCENFIQAATKMYQDFNVKSVPEVFKIANAAVAEYNTKAGQNDDSGNNTGYYAATGAYMVIRENRAYGATICDSFIAHFDKDMKLKHFSTGICEPYAVINGEERMHEGLEKGVLELEEGDRVFLLTDGFELHMRNPEFQKLFLEWDDTIKDRIKAFSAKMNLVDPASYGHERSLIAICI